MEFNVTEDEKFEQWILRVQPRLRYLASIVGRKSRTEAEHGRQEDLIAHLDNLLEDFSDISLEVKEMQTRAKEYYQDWLADETKIQLDSVLKPPAKKTAQDFAKNMNSSQRRIMDRIDALAATIDYRSIVSQSILKSMKP